MVRSAGLAVYWAGAAARILGITIAVASLMLAPSAVSAQVSVAGTWTLEVTTDNGVTHPTVVLQQEGATLTGEYSSEALGRAAVQGSVEGAKATFTFSGSIQGQSIPVRYTGTLGEDGRLTGTLDIADGMLTGTFVGTRSGS